MSGRLSDLLDNSPRKSSLTLLTQRSARVDTLAVLLREPERLDLDRLDLSPPGAADVVVDVSNSPAFEPAAVLEFFETSTRNLLAAEADAGETTNDAAILIGEKKPALAMLTRHFRCHSRGSLA